MVENTEETPKSHIALVAIRMAPGLRTSEPQAIVVGTMPKDVPGWKEGDWRYVTYRLGTLLEILNKDQDPLVPKGAPAVGDFAPWATEAEAKAEVNRFDNAERKELDALLPADYLNKSVTVGGKTIKRVFTAFPLRSVERIFFYSFAKGEASEKLQQPFSMLDTARLVDPSESRDVPVPFGKILPAGGDPGSRIVLVPDFSDPGRPGLLAALAVHLEVKVAVNAHSEAEPEPSATDPLLLLDAGVVNRPAALWLGPDGRGASFDVLRLRCTLGKGLRSHGITLKAGDRDLIRLATDEKARAEIQFLLSGKVADGESQRPPAEYFVEFMPALDRLGLPKITFANGDRKLGFRVLEPGAEGVPQKIGWRFETSLFSYGRKFAKSVVGRLIPERLVSGDGIIERLPVDMRATFAEEQRVGDITFAPHRRESKTALTVSLVDPDATDQKDIDKVLTADILAVASQTISGIQLGLKRVRDGRPISLLPRLKADKFVSWNAAGFLTNTAPGHRLDPRARDTSRSGALVTFEPVTTKKIWQAKPKLEDLEELKEATATFNLWLNEERLAPVYEASLSAPWNRDLSFQPLVSNSLSAEVRGTVFSVTLVKRKAVSGRVRQRNVLMGALELTLGDTFVTDKGFDTHGEIRLLPLAADNSGNADQLNTAIDAKIIVPITRVDPGGQDDSDRDVIVNTRQRRSRDLTVVEPDRFAPLLLPLSAGTSDSVEAALKLTAEEAATRNRDHTIALSLQAIEESDAAQPPAPAGPGRVLVIDPRPFRIAAVEYQPITSTATSESNEVAVWNAEGEGGLSWRVRDDGQSVGLELPPQVIGEAMEKNSSDLADRPADIQPGKPAAARFGSPTKLRIDPTFADTRFREPGWNLRRILGNALQRLPGARLLDLRLELLYGMLTRVRTEGLLLTELAGAIGEPALPLFDTLDLDENHIEEHEKLIDAVLEAERFRLAVDKVYRVRPDEYLRIENGTSFKLRLRRFEDNGAFKGGPKTPLRWPVPGGLPEDTGGLIQPEVLQQTFSTSNRDSESFPGGLSWAFESANIAMSVYGRPQGDGGNVGGIYLSAHGGYGSQRALFDSRKSIVETETTQGRAHRYRLERVGRIGCLWHPAKHVIVYERTVVPSAQFYNSDPIGLRQDEHAGRAILRKVEEYVEILKPVRQYPEDGSSVRAAGCLIGAEFKSIKIRVDSDWGSDVRREGWQVPLWNTKFAGLPVNPENPDDPASIYPKPQIRFTFAGRDKNVTLEVDEPAKLVFYTSVLREEDDRTDLWKPVRDIDFCDAPKISAGHVQTESADLTDAILPPEPEHVPGYEKFTIGLVPSKDAVNLAHGRVAEGPAATLRNVTIARSVALSTTENVPEFGRGLGAKVANVRAELDRQVGRVAGALEKLDRDLDPEALKTQANKLIAEACRNLNLVVESIEGLGKDQDKLLETIPVNCNGIASRARAYVDGQLGRFTTVANELFDSAAKSILERIDAAAGVIEAEVGVVDALAARVEQGAGDLERRPREEVKRTLAELRGLVASGRAAIQDVKAHAKERIDAQIDRLRKDLEKLLENLQADLKEARKKTVANLNAVRALLGTALSDEAEKLASAVDAVRDEVVRCHHELEIGAGTITQQARDAAVDVKKKVGEAREKIKPLKEKAPEGARRLLEKIEGGLAKMESLANFVETASDTAFDKAMKLATAARDEVVAIAAEFRKAKDEIVGLGGDLLKDLEEKLTAILDGAIKKAEELVAAADDQKSKILTALDDVANHAKDAIDALERDVTRQLDALAKAIPADDQIPASLQEIIEKLREIGKQLRKAAADFRGALKAAGEAAKEARVALTTAIEQKTKELKTALDTLASAVRAKTDELIKQITDQCSRLVGEFRDLAKDVFAHANKRIAEAIDIEYLKHDLERDLQAVVGEATESLAEIKAKVAARAAAIAREAEARVREVAATIQQKVQNVVGADLAEAARRAEGVYQKGNDALRLIRAVGDPPKTDSLGFNRPEVAYVFGEAKELGIDVTPTLALVNRAADQVAAVEKAGKAVGELLDSFGVRLPVTQIADQLIPDKLRNLSVSDLLPDMGGIDLRGLLQRVGFPDLDDSDAVKVRHGFDKAERRAWMEADLDVPFAESVPLLSFGPVQLMIDTARFNSRARLSAAPGSGIERKMNGRIFGDWRVVCGGQTLLTFRQTELRFEDSGQIDFQIQPDRVELAAALQFITDLMRATGQKGGLRIEPFLRGGIPAGVAAKLDMVLPPIQTGAFGISDLSLHVLFGVSALPRFEIVSELAVGSRLTPFSLNVWILTGGGYLTQRLTYVPMAKPKPLLTYTLDIAIVAGLGISFSAGVASGGVWLQVGCGIALTWTTGAGGNSTTLRVFLLARGNVDVAGIITVSIALLFEISYDGERLIGAGTLSIRVKISVFFTLSVDEHVEYVFAGQKKQEQIGGNGSADAYC